MGTKFRNHISIVLERFGVVFFGAVFVCFGSIVDDIKDIWKHPQKMGDMLDEEVIVVAIFMILLLVVLLWQFRIWSKTYISVQNESIVIEKNTWSRKVQTIGFKNISNINLEQNILERMLDTCTVKMNTNSRSTADETDVTLVLKKEKAEWLRKIIIGTIETNVIQTKEKEPSVTAAASVQDMIWHGIFSISVVSVILAVIGIGGTVSAIVSSVQNGLSADNILAALSGWAVAFFIGMAAIWDIAKDFVKYYQYSVERKEDKIYISYGLLKKANYTIPVKYIHAVIVKQTWIARIFNRYRVELVNVGMGDDDSENDAFFLLYQEQESVLEKMTQLLPEFADGMRLPLQKQKREVIWLKMIKGIIWTMVLGIIDVTLKQIFPEYGRWIVLFGILAVAVLVIVLAGSYMTAAFACDDKNLATSTGVFGRSIVYMHYPQIQYLKFQQNFIAKKMHVLKGNAYLLAQATNARQALPYMPEEAAEELGLRILAG